MGGSEFKNMFHCLLRVDLLLTKFIILPFPNESCSPDVFGHLPFATSLPEGHPTFYYENQKCTLCIEPISFIDVVF